MLENIARDAYKLKIQIKTLEAKLSENMDILRKQANGETTRWGNYRIVVTSRPGLIEYNAIPELKTVNLEIYRKPSINVYKIECLGE